MSLTLFRIVAVPIVAVFYLLPYQWSHWAAAIIFIIAALTDWLDGYLARSLSQTTKLGEFLDPVADKLLVGVILVLIVGEHSIPYIAIPAAIIIGREITISALREWMAEVGKRASVRVSHVAKIKTFLQLFALILLVWYHPDGQKWVMWNGVIILYLAAAMTLWTMYHYLTIAWSDLTMLREKQ